LYVYCSGDARTQGKSDRELALLGSLDTAHGFTSFTSTPPAAEARARVVLEVVGVVEVQQGWRSQ
jgi:hypothetical protein